MNSRLLRYLFCSLLMLAISPNRVNSQDLRNQVILPAGTLLRCTLNEPNFSAKTAEVGDPVICSLGEVLLFDAPAFPRGAYLSGHLEADKPPGHFIGKGYLKLEFDRIGLPNAVLPVPAKIIAAAGYKVDKEGKIIGHGHPTRDLAGWMIPPLWPIKVLTLPQRGPYPKLKGEERLTLRLMDDAVIPGEPQLTSGWHYFGRSSLQGWPQPFVRPAPSHVAAGPAVATPSKASTPPTSQPADVTSPSSATSKSAPQNVLVLRSGTTAYTTSLRVDGDRVTYKLTDGTSAAVKLSDVDWTSTFQSNAENGTMLAFTNEGTAH